MEHHLFEKAKALHQAGNTRDAEAAYRETIAMNPRAFKALSNLGALLEQQDRGAEAMTLYRQALEAAPTSAPVHFNLGHALQVDGQFEGARASYRRALECDADYFPAAFNLGRCCYELGLLEEAAVAFSRASELDPDSLPACSSLGGVYWDLGRLEDALGAYRKAVAIDPDSDSEHFNLGKTLEALGRMEEASEAYRIALDGNPRSIASKESLGRILHSMGKQTEAVEFLEEWIRREPDAPVPRHMLASITGENVGPRASDSYVRETFDRFAGDFDATLERLDYRAPQLLAAVLVDDCGAGPRQYRMLDAGCGTGLCGPLLRPYAAHLTGVDLSPGMLEKARARGTYDELAAAELTAFLEEHPAAYDAIVCADTLCYFGDLVPVLRAAAGSLEPGGVFLFTVERLTIADPGTGYVLNPHGRYSHDEGYVRHTVEEAGFQVHSITLPTLRREAGLPVIGLLVRAERR